jgi:hypothetical protein
MRTIAVVIGASSDFKCGNCVHTRRGSSGLIRCCLFDCMLNYVPKAELPRNSLYDYYRCKKCVMAESRMKKGSNHG